MVVKVFNHKISYCTECPFFREGNFCEYLNKDINSHSTHRECKCYDEINNQCPFLKELDETDLKDLGFKRFENTNIYERFSLDGIYQLELKNRKVAIRIYDMRDLSENFYVEFDINSKPHLEFILKSLSILN